MPSPVTRRTEREALKAYAKQYSGGRTRKIPTDTQIRNFLKTRSIWAVVYESPRDHADVIYDRTKSSLQRDREVAFGELSIKECRLFARQLKGRKVIISHLTEEENPLEGGRDACGFILQATCKSRRLLAEIQLYDTPIGRLMAMLIMLKLCGSVSLGHKIYVPREGYVPPEPVELTLCVLGAREKTFIFIKKLGVPKPLVRPKTRIAAENATSFFPHRAKELCNGSQSVAAPTSVPSTSLSLSAQPGPASFANMATPAPETKVVPEDGAACFEQLLIAASSDTKTPLDKKVFKSATDYYQGVVACAQAADKHEARANELEKKLSELKASMEAPVPEVEDLKAQLMKASVEKEQLLKTMAQIQNNRCEQNLKAVALKNKGNAGLQAAVEESRAYLASNPSSLNDLNVVFEKLLPHLPTVEETRKRPRSPTPIAASSSSSSHKLRSVVASHTDVTPRLVKRKRYAQVPISVRDPFGNTIGRK